MVDLDVPDAALGAACPPDAALLARPGDVRPRGDPAHRLFGEGAHLLGDVFSVAGVGNQDRPVGVQGVGDRVAGLLEVDGQPCAGPVGVQSGPAVRDHRLRQVVEREPLHGVADLMFHDLRDAVPALYLEEHPEAGTAGGGAVVHGDGCADVGGVEDDAGLFPGLAHQGRDHVFPRAV